MGNKATWRVAENWAAQQSLIAVLYHTRGVTAGMTLARLLATHADPGPGYGFQPADFGRERRTTALPPPAPDSTEAKLAAERDRAAEERYREARDRLAARFRLVPDRRRVSRDEMADIRRKLAAAPGGC